MVWHTRLVAVAGLAAVLQVLPAGSAEAQRPGARLGRFEVPGFDFAPDGAWRKRTNQIRQARRGMLQSGAFGSLNAAGPSGTRVSGNVNVPVLLISYSNSPMPFTTPEYQDVLFNPAPTVRPYSVKTYYEEISNNNITMSGTVFNAILADQTNAYYQDGCNGIGITTCGSPLSSGVSSHFRDLIVEVLTKANGLGTINWGMFDNDGPDGNPNSGDDDGSVDFITFIQPEVDGACGAQGIWAHRWTVAALRQSSPFATSTPRTGGGFIQINDYTIQSGQGGNGSCSVGQIMPVGTIAHETGHAFGIPDLYDTFGGSEGIGEWGTMGSGNYARPYSPAGFDAWSVVELGWVTVDTLGASQTVTLDPVQTADKVVYIPLAGTDEYLLLENRDSLLSDTAQMNSAFSRKKSPGLLIWHIDPSVIAANMSANTVNSGSVHGVALEQADGLNHLRCTSLGCGNRGDAGDAYPGSTVNRRWTTTSNPASRTNAGAYAGFIIDSIYRNESGTPGVPSPVVFRYIQRRPSVFTTSRPGANIKVNSVTTPRFDDVIAPGDNVTLEAISPQTINSGRTRLTYASWSDGGAATHTIVSGASPDTIVASFSAEHRILLTSAPNGGTVSSDISGNPVLTGPGVLVPENTPVTLTATPVATGDFIRFQGDTTTTNTTLVLPMGRGYNIQALFTGGVTIVTQDAVNALLGVACTQNPCLTTEQLTFLDDTGNDDGTYNLGDFLAYADRSGLNPASEIMQRLLSQPTVSVPITAPDTPKER
jgi:M6 family metalloprotease-like protein